MNRLFSIIAYKQQQSIWYYQQAIYKINISYFNNSIWSLLLTNILFLLLLNFMCYIVYSITFSITVFIILSLLTLSCSWYYIQSYIDFNIEANLMKRKLYLGVIFLIMTEFAFFFTFFYSYGHLSLSPSIELGIAWPPQNTYTIILCGIPLINTILLIFSSITLEYAKKKWELFSQTNLHLNKEYNFYLTYRNTLLLTIFLGLIFIIFQAIEFSVAFFTLNDNSFSSIFFFITGCHGLHVIVGLIWLIWVYKNNGTSTSIFQKTSLYAATLYWHFVDCIWIFVIFFLYFLNGPIPNSFNNNFIIYFNDILTWFL